MEIFWRAAAAQDLAHARAYIAEHNPAAANRVFGAILAGVRSLRDFPQRGRVGRVADTRELVVSDTPYIVAYTVAGERIEILAVMHAARQWPDQLSD